MSAGSDLRAARKAKGMSASEAAKSVGCCAGYYYALESGRLTRPGTIIAENLSLEFGVDPAGWDIPQRNGKRESSARRSEAQALRASGMTLQAVADRIGVSRQRVDQMLNPEKMRARAAVFCAVKSGKIARPTECERCSRKLRRTFAHHEDYANPLQVNWLCARCHGKADKDLFRRMGRKRSHVVTKSQSNHPLFLARSAVGMALSDLSAAIGMSDAHRLAMVERGQIRPPLHFIRPLAEALKVSCDEVLSWFERKPRKVSAAPGRRREFDAEKVRTSLIAARAQKGLSQRDFAAAVGVSKASVIVWEAGVGTPRSASIGRIAETLDLSPETVEAIFGKAA